MGYIVKEVKLGFRVRLVGFMILLKSYERVEIIWVRLS